MKMKPGLTGFLAHGVTLVELVLSIAVIGAALAGVTLIFVRNISSSADPVIWRQATAVAEAYLEEILAKNFTADGAEASRDLFDDIWDYNTIVAESPPRDQNGNQVPALAGYTVTVQVIAEALGNPIIPGANATRVQITVTNPAGGAIVVSGYRTNDGT